MFKTPNHFRLVGTKLLPKFRASFQFITFWTLRLNLPRKIEPLHSYKTKRAVIAFFSNVNTSILNEKKQAPLHMATELNRVDVLNTMLKYRDKFDLQQGGEHGRTALHLAAIYDHDECAKILVSHSWCWIIHPTFMYYGMNLREFFLYPKSRGPMCARHLRCSDGEYSLTDIHLIEGYVNVVGLVAGSDWNDIRLQNSLRYVCRKTKLHFNNREIFLFLLYYKRKIYSRIKKILFLHSNIFLILIQD